jgi:ABC-type transport system involved in multi-copper enzyme maturation permease subunit
MKDLPSIVFTIRCLVRDTFRQSLASRTFWLVLGLSGVCILLCLSVSVSGVTAHRPPGEIELFGPDGQPFTGLSKSTGQLSIAFGAIRLNLFRDAEAEVNFLQVLLAKWGAGAVGLLLALVWSAGFLPDFFRPEAASVLLAKPVPRGALLLGKYLGVLAFVTFQTTVFIGGTWMALGLRTGIWSPGYLLSIPLLLLQFTILFSFSALLAVRWRSTIVCVFGSVLLWALCSAVNFSRHSVVARADLAPDAAPVAEASQWAAEAGYWILPKPNDLTYFLDQALDSARHFQASRELEVVRKKNALFPELSVVTSLAFALGVLALAVRRFAVTDY